MLSPVLAHWWAALALLALMLATNEHVFPFLTPVVRKVVDARSLLVHACVMIAVAIFLLRFRIDTLVRGTLAFGVASAALYAVLSALAIAEMPLFTYRYPFTNAWAIAFPFPSYNMASAFIAVACLGLLGAAYSLRKWALIVLCLPAHLLAVGLTGSRSGLLLFIGALAAFATIALWPLLRRADSGFRGRQAAWTAAVVVLGVGLVLGLGQYLQPIQRALSIFTDLAKNPIELVMGGKPGSPRYELWQLVREGHEALGPERNRPYSVRLVSIENGCVRNSAPIEGLQPGARYWLRLVQASTTGSGKAIVQVFSDAGMRDLVSETTIAHGANLLGTLSMYLADSGMRYVTQAGTLGGFTISVDGKRLANGARDPVSYFDPLNGAPGAPVGAYGDRVDILAHERRICGFINWAGTVPAPVQQMVLQYQVSLERVNPTVPLDSPVMFYVGVRDGGAQPGSSWNEIRNGLLIEHRRASTDYERNVLLQLDAQAVLHQVGGEDTNERRANFERFMKQRHCSPSGAYKVADLWKVDASGILENIDSIVTFATTNARVSRQASPAALSLDAAEPTWLPERHLRDRGSTHNVYLDWYFYEGAPALLLFLLFAGLLCAAAFFAGWRERNTQWAPFTWAVGLQVLVILAFMYAQPYIWLKFYWVVFGLASALAIKGGARAPAAQLP